MTKADTSIRNLEKHMHTHGWPVVGVFSSACSAEREGRTGGGPQGAGPFCVCDPWTLMGMDGRAPKTCGSGRAPSDGGLEFAAAAKRRLVASRFSRGNGSHPAANPILYCRLVIIDNLQAHNHHHCTRKADSATLMPSSAQCLLGSLSPWIRSGGVEL
jgi:hypothetical protein